MMQIQLAFKHTKSRMIFLDKDPPYSAKRPVPLRTLASRPALPPNSLSESHCRISLQVMALAAGCDDPGPPLLSITTWSQSRMAGPAVPVTFAVRAFTRSLQPWPVPLKKTDRPSKLWLGLVLSFCLWSCMLRPENHV
ncbi:hypothetical protein MYU51_013961 [Penicillium brevicompactum]